MSDSNKMAASVFRLAKVFVSDLIKLGFIRFNKTGHVKVNYGEGGISDVEHYEKVRK